MNIFQILDEAKTAHSGDRPKKFKEPNTFRNFVSFYGFFVDTHRTYRGNGCVPVVYDKDFDIMLCLHEISHALYFNRFNPDRLSKTNFGLHIPDVYNEVLCISEPNTKSFTSITNELFAFHIEGFIARVLGIMSEEEAFASYLYWADFIMHEQRISGVDNIPLSYVRTRSPTHKYLAKMKHRTLAKYTKATKLRDNIVSSLGLDPTYALTSMQKKHVEHVYARLGIKDLSVTWALRNQIERQFFDSLKSIREKEKAERIVWCLEQKKIYENYFSMETIHEQLMQLAERFATIKAVCKKE